MALFYLVLEKNKGEITNTTVLSIMGLILSIVIFAVSMLVINISDIGDRLTTIETKTDYESELDAIKQRLDDLEEEL